MAERVIKDYRYWKGTELPADFSEVYDKFLEIFHSFLNSFFNFANQIENIILNPPKSGTSVKLVFDITSTDNSLKEYHTTLEETVGKYVKKHKKGCFIATAVYGTPLATELDVLRQFRDKYLETNPAGKRIVSFYYAISPYLVPLISESDLRKRIAQTINISHFPQSSTIGGRRLGL